MSPSSRKLLEQKCLSPLAWFKVAIYAAPFWCGLACTAVFQAAHSQLGNLSEYEQPMLLLIYAGPAVLALTMVSISPWFRQSLIRILGMWFMFWIWAYINGSSSRVD